MFYGCTYCGSKEQDSALVLLEQFTQNKILHVFFEALCLIYIIFLDFGEVDHDCRMKISLLSRRIHVFWLGKTSPVFFGAASTLWKPIQGA